MSIDRLEGRAGYKLYDQLGGSEARIGLGLEALLLSSLEYNEYVEEEDWGLDKGRC